MQEEAVEVGRAQDCERSLDGGLDLVRDIGAGVVRERLGLVLPADGRVSGTVTVDSVLS